MVVYPAHRRHSRILCRRTIVSRAHRRALIWLCVMSKNWTRSPHPGQRATRNRCQGEPVRSSRRMSSRHGQSITRGRLSCGDGGCSGRWGADRSHYSSVRACLVCRMIGSFRQSCQLLSCQCQRAEILPNRVIKWSLGCNRDNGSNSCLDHDPLRASVCREDCHILAARERHRQGTGIELS